MGLPFMNPAMLSGLAGAAGGSTGALKGINSFLDSPLGDLTTGGLTGGLSALGGNRQAEEERKRREEEDRKRRQLETLALIQHQFQNNIGNTMQLAQLVQGLSGRRGGFG